MDEREIVAQQFEQHRSHLHAVAFRMLGSPGEADDAVQEAWLRLHRSDTSAVENLGGWLTTVVARVCLDMLRSRTSRREESLEPDLATPARPSAGSGDPEHDVVMADAVGLALLVVLETLSPTERLAFVLHDMFAVPFEEIATIVGGSAAAARQSASRARRRVQGAGAAPEADASRRREVVDAFLAASRGGDFGALLVLLDPDVALRADAAAVAMGAAAEVRGARAVAETLSGRAQAARRAVIDGAPGAVWAPGGRPRVVFAFTILGERIIEIELLADPAQLTDPDLVILEA